MFFRGKIHRTIFEKEIHCLPHEASDRMKAALYLLTADHSIWSASKKAIENNHICFEKVRLSNATADGYVLYRTARDLYLKESQITVSDLADRGIVSDWVLQLIQSAINIRRGKSTTNRLFLFEKEGL